MSLHPGGDTRLIDCDFDAKIRNTHLGQAHLAGTGPANTTCRQCRFFGLIRSPGQGGLGSPGYYSKSNKLLANTLKPGKCHAPMTHKANRKFPHTAGSCRLFEAADCPFPPVGGK